MTSNERFRRLIIWVSILAVAAFAVMAQRMRDHEEPAAADAVAEEAAAVAPVSLQTELAAKMTFALHRLAPTMPPAQILTQAEALKDGAFSDRLAYSVLVGAIEGWEAGADDARKAPLPEVAVEPARALRDRVIAVMERNAERGEDAMTPEDRDSVEAVRSSLGDVADVLLPEGPAEATATVVAMVAAAGWYIAAFLGGLCVLAVGFVLLAAGKIRPSFAPVSNAHHALILGEAFLLWIVLFLGLNIGSALLLPALGDSAPELLPLAVSIGCFFASLLAALGYPLARGMSAREVRQAIGLHRGAGFAKEAFAGVLCYLSAVPLLAAGLVVFAILSMIAKLLEGPTAPPSHPAVEMLGGAGAGRILMLFLLASVTAPIVEEIMFRGFLYGHLRGSCAPRIRVASMIVAALASSVVFAIIHPQGVLFVPALGGLAVGFCLFREVRGSLVAPMVAHGINNAVTLTLGLTLLS
ncbi:MAG: hypothetical protein RL325_1249 [Planctomycetota bacterium]|jgi:membrane protease YdiL (CAAX protease family)